MFSHSKTTIITVRYCGLSDDWSTFWTIYEAVNISIADEADFDTAVAAHRAEVPLPRRRRRGMENWALLD